MTLPNLPIPFPVVRKYTEDDLHNMLNAQREKKDYRLGVLIATFILEMSQIPAWKGCFGFETVKEANKVQSIVNAFLEAEKELPGEGHFRKDDSKVGLTIGQSVALNRVARKYCGQLLRVLNAELEYREQEEDKRKEGLKRPTRIRRKQVGKN